MHVTGMEETANNRVEAMQAAARTHSVLTGSTG